MFSRQLFRTLASSRKSVLLLGPRQTGKSTLIAALDPGLSINLAREDTFATFAANPAELEQRISAFKGKSIFIDEVQRLPSLLNTIQAVLDERKNLIFYLTGSSDRKLRRGQANLLPGRVHTYTMGPLTVDEIGSDFDLMQALAEGTLPGIYSDPEKASRRKTLRSYAGTYLKEEIQAEALTRNIEGFSRFLNIAAATSGEFLDLTKLSSEARIPRQTAGRFFEILEDTLIVNRCESFAKTDRKRLIQHPKYYFFDLGVLNALLGNFNASPDRKGTLFEHFFFNQLTHGAAALDIELRISTFRTSNGAEVDFIIERDHQIFAVELKASTNVGKSDLRGLDSFGAFVKRSIQPIVACLSDAPRKIEGVDVLPWRQALALVLSG
jgi:predicted AAA+ superfamily ATPase